LAAPLAAPLADAFFVGAEVDSQFSGSAVLLGASWCAKQERG
jgi:hypothetical protein